MPENLQQYFTLDKTIQIGISVGILLIFLILRKIFTKYLFNLIFNLTNKPKTEIFKQVIVAFDKPARWFFVALGLFWPFGIPRSLMGRCRLSAKCTVRLLWRCCLGVFVI